MILPIVLAASVIGAIVGIAHEDVVRRLREGRYVPFGPFLAGAGLVVLFAGPSASSAGCAGPERQRRRAPHDRLRIGLTGGIGSGKSTVGALLGGLGAALIDTDAIARRADAARRRRHRRDPRRLRRRLHRRRRRPRPRRACATPAFDDAARERRLEAILHPLIGPEAERAGRAAAARRVLVFDVPLLVESGRWRSRVDRVWSSTASEATQVERVVARPGWSEAAARAVIAQQAPRAARRAAADAVIHNDGISLAELGGEVRRPLAALRSRPRA